MGKHKTKEEGILLFNKYEQGEWNGDLLYATVKRPSRESRAKRKSNRSPNKWKQYARRRFRNKYKEGKLLDNLFMEKIETRGRKKIRDDSDIPKIIDKLNDEQKREIIEHGIKSERDKKDKKGSVSEMNSLTISLKAEILGLHRTTFYKKSIKRKYKFDFMKDLVNELFTENKKIYGSRRLAILLERKGYTIDSRTLRHYMNRWGMSSVTRVKKKKGESKNTNVKFHDLVKRNFNPTSDNIIATDVSYIPAKTEHNNIYLSVAISHKTKLVEGGSLSLLNDTQLVVDTLNQLERREFILHSDHGSQYSSHEVLEKIRGIQGRTSMSRIGNSLDNREIEYFFGCLKGEYLNHIDTSKLSLVQIREHIEGYINGYNTKRIQSRLQGKTPTEVSAYAI